MRQFRPEDLPAVSDLLRRTIDASYAGVYPPLAIAHFHEHHTADEIAADAEQGYAVVLELDGRIVATGTLVGNDVRRVYVDPACQGQGLGTAIMRALEGRARGDGIAEIDLYSSVVAKPFYDRLGYAVVEEGAGDVGEGQVLRYFRMVKRLAPVGSALGEEGWSTRKGRR